MHIFYISVIIRKCHNLITTIPSLLISDTDLEPADAVGELTDAQSGRPGRAGDESSTRHGAQELGQDTRAGPPYILVPGEGAE